jgi:hypothetical protein
VAAIFSWQVGCGGKCGVLVAEDEEGGRQAASFMSTYYHVLTKYLPLYNSLHFKTLFTSKDSFRHYVPLTRGVISR